MSPKTEQNYAKQLLISKEGFSLWRVYLRMLPRYLIVGLLFFLVERWMSSIYHSSVCADIFIGIFVGMVARDFGWLIRTKDVWPLYQKIIDWQKVEALAHADAQAQNVSGVVPKGEPT